MIEEAPPKAEQNSRQDAGGTKFNRRALHPARPAHAIGLRADWPAATFDLVLGADLHSEPGAKDGADAHHADDRPKKTVEVEFLVDSGAIYSVVPGSILRKLGVKPHSKQVFTLADGSHITRGKGDVLFRLDGKQGMAPVIFGEKGDSVLLGVVSLEALGLILDPIKRELRPLPMILGGKGPAR